MNLSFADGAKVQKCNNLIHCHKHSVDMNRNKLKPGAHMFSFRKFLFLEYFTKWDLKFIF